MVASSRWPVKRWPVGGGHIAAAVPVQAAGVAGAGDDGVGLEPSVNIRIISPCPVVVQAAGEAVFVALAGVVDVGLGGRGGGEWCAQTGEDDTATSRLLCLKLPEFSQRILNTPSWNELEDMQLRRLSLSIF